MDHSFEGVLFSEGKPEGVREMRAVSIELNAKFFGGSQLKTLDDVKKELAAKVKAAGGDTLMKFEYGQKHVSFWKHMFSLDSVAWWGKGVIGRRS